MAETLPQLLSYAALQDVLDSQRDGTCTLSFLPTDDFQRFHAAFQVVPCVCAFVLRLGFSLLSVWHARASHAICEPCV